MWLSVDQRAHWYPKTSPYTYVLNNPVNLIDPSGMSSEEPSWFGNFFQKLGNWVSRDGWKTNQQIADEANAVMLDEVVIVERKPEGKVCGGCVTKKSAPSGRGIYIFGSGSDGVDNWNTGLNPLFSLDMNDPFWSAFSVWGQKGLKKPGGGPETAADGIVNLVDVYETAKELAKEKGQVANVPEIPQPTRVDSSDNEYTGNGGGILRSYRSENSPEFGVDSTKFIPKRK